MSELLHIVCPQCNATNRVPVLKLEDKAQCGKCRQALFNAQPLQLTSMNFAKQLGANEIPLLIDFWAPWCGPCRMMAPVFEQAAARLEPRVRLAKINTEAEPTLGAHFNIRSIPTLALFSGGHEIARQAGAVDLGSLLRWVESHL